MIKTPSYVWLVPAFLMGVFSAFLWVDRTDALTLASQLTNTDEVCALDTGTNDCKRDIVGGPTDIAPWQKVGAGVNATTTTMFLTLNSTTGTNLIFSLDEYSSSDYASTTQTNSFAFSSISPGVGRRVVTATHAGVYMRSDRYYAIQFNTGASDFAIWGRADGQTSGNENSAGSWYYALTSDATTPGLDWGAIQLNPPIDFEAITFVATSSSLFSAESASSTLAYIADRCDDSGNIFARGICWGFSFLFIPDPQILNSFATLPELLQTKFPFLWVTEIKISLSALTATGGTEQNYSLNLADLEIGENTPMGNILPNFTAFSSSTVTQYVPDALWSAGQALIGAVLWLLLGADIYATVRRRHAHT